MHHEFPSAMLAILLLELYQGGVRPTIQTDVNSLIIISLFHVPVRHLHCCIQLSKVRFYVIHPKEASINLHMCN